MKINLNKKQTIAIAAIVIIGFLLGGLILLSGKNSSSSGDAHGHSAEHADTEHHEGTKKDKHAHDDSAKHADGEHHEKKAEGEAHDAENKIVLSDAQIKTAGVTLLTANAAHIKTALILPGEIQFNEDRTAHVVPRLAGVVQSVPANLGQQVKKGQVLAVIASTGLSEQRSELFAAQKRLTLAKLTFDREKKLWQEKISAEQDYLQAQQTLHETEIAVQNARQKLAALGADAGSSGAFNRYEIRAPFDGIVVEKHIALGEAVKEDANIFTLSDLSSVWAEIAVPAKDLNAVRVGEKVKVTASAFDSSASGTIAYVGSLLGIQTRTAKARVTLANPQGTWRPGLFVNVEIVANEVEVPVAVATDAIQSINDKPVVFVKVADGFIAQEVTTGRSDGKLVEIVKGLKAGMEYAAAGSFVIKSELGKASAEHTH
ncbi:efflux RND transporter periplasmic adaptor subunit [Herminiimonas arsenitoxidans]|uniref:efflux RND transporter periplasmic adaptor subunit n=1 Tax=Herminiimonas arsenitoxidans TaxID=1809410 RepID=UPI0009706547|nr:efflux RND transporter periplasmic adaptor subunit [Herminiimonas arsenitoxidans]